MSRTVCAQMHEHKLKVTGTELHPLAAVPEALEALRLKAATRRMNELFKCNLSASRAVVKLQALRRGNVTRQTTKMRLTSSRMS